MDFFLGNAANTPVSCIHREKQAERANKYGKINSTTGLSLINKTRAEAKPHFDPFKGRSRLARAIKLFQMRTQSERVEKKRQKIIIERQSRNSEKNASTPPTKRSRRAKRNNSEV